MLVIQFQSVLKAKGFLGSRLLRSLVYTACWRWDERVKNSQQPQSPPYQSTRSGKEQKRERKKRTKEKVFFFKFHFGWCWQHEREWRKKNLDILGTFFRLSSHHKIRIFFHFSQWVLTRRTSLWVQQATSRLFSCSASVEWGKIKKIYWILR